jgi:hypothetical protein
MRPVAKAGLVVVGYVAAFAVAWLAVSIYAFATSGPDRQQYGAMFAFGDSLLFLAVFGLAAVPPTGAALYFLRGRPGFWVTLSVGSLAIASTGLAAFVYSSSPFATLRILVAPLFVLFFLLAGLVAPNRSARIALIAATAIEAVAFACAVLSWLHPFQHR